MHRYGGWGSGLGARGFGTGLRPGHDGHDGTMDTMARKQSSWWSSCHRVHRASAVGRERVDDLRHELAINDADPRDGGREFGSSGRAYGLGTMDTMGTTGTMARKLKFIVVIVPSCPSCFSRRP
jgi:hypothetical protein